MGQRKGKDRRGMMPPRIAAWSYAGLHEDIGGWRLPDRAWPHDTIYVPEARALAAEAQVAALTAERGELRETLEWLSERLSGFAPGSWESTLAARARKALAPQEPRP